MKTLRDIMRSGFLFTVQKKTTVSEAVHLMADHNVGIVIVLDGDRLAGVFSERDVVRRVLHQGVDPATVPVNEVMTPNVVTADAEMAYETAMREMDGAAIRHLLVTSGSKLLSMISIRDLTRAVLRDREEEIQFLREYLYQEPQAVRPCSNSRPHRGGLAAGPLTEVRDETETSLGVGRFRIPCGAGPLLRAG